MSTPWFLDHLDLPAGTDAKSVRRAYASRLKSIDHEANPAAFATLRRAYEEALSWVSREPLVVDIASVASVARADPDDKTDLPDVPTSEEGSTEPSHVEEAMRLIDGFVSALADTSDRDLPHLLESTTVSLRRAYVDAPSVFEERLIDLLANSDMQRRAPLFFAATDHFHWNELDRLKELGQRGAWVDAVLVQRALWDQHGTAQRSAWSGLLAQAQRSPLAAELLPRWPTARTLLKTFPAYLRLFLEPAVVAEWQARFAGLPDKVREQAEAREGTIRSPEPARPRGRANKSGGVPIWAIILFLSVIGQVARFAAPDHPAPPQPETGIPAASANARPYCVKALLYLRNGYFPSSMDEAAMKREVLQVSGPCLLMGDWPHDPAIYSALDRLEKAGVKRE